jgi:hypothetical protein
LRSQSFFSVVANGDLTSLKLLNPALIEELINETDRASGLTPLMLAVKSRSAETANWLISQRANSVVATRRKAFPLPRWLPGLRRDGSWQRPAPDPARALICDSKRDSHPRLTGVTTASDMPIHADSTEAR